MASKRDRRHRNKFQNDRSTACSLNSIDRSIQIYKYLKTRMHHSPIFLQRNLSYMKGPISRSLKPVREFKVDQMLDHKMKSLNLLHGNLSYMKGRTPRKPRRVFKVDQNTGQKIESPIFLQSSLPHMSEGISRSLKPKSEFKVDQILGQKMKTPKNVIITGVTDGQLWIPGTIARVDVMFASVSPDNGPVTKLSEKTVAVKIYSPNEPTPPFQISLPSPEGSVSDVVVPVSSKYDDNENELVMIIRVTVPGNCLVPYHRSIKFTILSQRKFTGENCVVYTGSISLAKGKDDIAEADIDVILKRNNEGSGGKISFQSVRRGTSWVGVDQEPELNIIEERTEVLQPGKVARISFAIRTSTSKNCQLLLPLPSAPVKKKDAPHNNSTRIIYRYHQESSSHTPLFVESRDDQRCPWCSLKCYRLYSLLHHLELCHSRFQLSYSKIPEIENSVQVEVTLNSSFDVNDEEKDFFVRGCKWIRCLSDTQCLEELFDGDGFLKTSD